MKMLVVGGTGVVGRPLVARLVSAGHDVTALARNEERAGVLREAGVRPVVADLFDLEAMTAAVDGQDAVINVATRIPPASRMALPRSWRENDRIRREGTRVIATAVLARGVPRYVQESGVFPYAAGGDAWLDEDSPLQFAAHTRSLADAEASAARVADSGATGVALRFGMFWGSEGPTTRTMVAVARRGFFPLAGRRTDRLSIIVPDDAAAAAVAALELPSGVYNVVDDEPLTRAEHAVLLGEAVGRTPLRILGRTAARLGGPVVAALARSQRVSNRRLREASSWRPSVPSARQAYEAWRTV
jgi:nucleoside-diphosphate-sugar epimerase